MVSPFEISILSSVENEHNASGKNLKLKKALNPGATIELFCGNFPFKKIHFIYIPLKKLC